MDKEFENPPDPRRKGRSGPPLPPPGALPDDAGLPDINAPLPPSRDREPAAVQVGLARLQDQIQSLASTVANQQSVMIDIAGARTAELHTALVQMSTIASELREETQRLRSLQDAISHHLHDLVLDVVQPELRSQLSTGLPKLVGQAMAPELRAMMQEILPQVVAGTVSPDVRSLLAEWLPVMVTDTVQPELRQALAEQLPGMTANAVQPEVRRVLAERLPTLVADTIQPEIYRALVDRLPGIVRDTVTPELREVVLAHLPHLVAETVRPEVRETLEERLPSVVAQIVSPEVRRTLAERLPSLVSETVQPELRQTLTSRLPGIIAEVVSPAVGALLLERVPAMLAEVVTPELSVTLAETESAAAALRQEAAKLRSLREVVAERLPEAVMGALEPAIEEIMSVRFPRMVSEMVSPLVRASLAEEMPNLVARAVQPGILQSLSHRVPELVTETIRPELRSLLVHALEERLPSVVGDVVRPELRQRLIEDLPGVIASVITPEVLALVTSSLPSIVGEAVTPELSVSLAEIEGTAAEMRAETARLRSLREVVTDRLPDAVMAAVRGSMEATIVPRLPEMLAQLVRPALQEAISAPLPAALEERLEPALERIVDRALARELPDLVRRTLEREVQLGLGESLPSLIADSAGPGIRAGLAGVEQTLAGLGDVREELMVRLEGLARDAAAAPFPDLSASSSQLREEVGRLGEAREEMLRRLPELVAQAVAAPMAAFESSAEQLRIEAERLRAVRGEVADQLPALVQDVVAAALASLPAGGGPSASNEAVAASLAGVEASASQLQAEAVELREVRNAIARELPRLVTHAVDTALAERQVAPPAPAVAPAVPAPPPMSAPGVSAPVVGAEAEPEAPVAGRPGRPAPAPAPLAAPPVADPARSAVDPSLAAALAPPANGSRIAVEAAVAGDVTEVACVLPGVVVGPTLARGISEAVGRGRLRRRRRRRAGPPSAGLHRRDPFATELTRRLEWFSLARRQATTTNGAATANPVGPGTIPIGELDGQEVSLPLGREGGVCLIGPRSREVARALVLTFLAQNDDHVGRAIVVGDLFPSTTTFPGLGRAKDVGSVLEGLQDEASRRENRLAEAGAADVDAYRSHRPDEPLPLILVAAAEMTAADAGRLGSLLDAGARLGILGLLVDTQLEGAATVRLQGPGRVSSVTPPSAGEGLVGARLFTVERDPGAEMLDVLASARTDIEGEDSAAPADEPFQGLPSPSAMITVRLLGEYRIDANGREIKAGLRGKAKELLAFYLLHPEGTTLEEATEALWPEADPRRGSEWFWTALGNLRSRLRKATENSDLKVIEREGDRYRIEPLFEVDLWQFQAALSVAGTSSADPSWPDNLQRAADLYGGELLSGTDWPWTEVPREDLRGRAVDVLVSLAATRLIAGEMRGALDALETAVEIDPLAEQLYRRIMRLHAKLARPDQADAAFRSLVARLEEFDLAPSPESEKLHEELCGTG